MSVSWEQYHRGEELVAMGRTLTEWVAEWLGCKEDWEEIDRVYYKSTGFGGWCRSTERGFCVGSIVEGSEATFDFEYVMTGDEEKEDVHSWLRERTDELDALTDAAWREANDDEGERPT